MNEYMPSEKEMINSLIDKYADLQRIKKSADLANQLTDKKRNTLTKV